MGQQQLLLLVLSIVIVGLAVVVGIQAFSENQKKANADALIMTSMRIASDAQAWLRKPAAFGGAVTGIGVRPTDFNGLSLSLQQLGYPVNGSGSMAIHVDINGTYTAAIDGADFVITASSAVTSGSAENNLICVRVSGSLVGDIETRVNPVSGSC